MIPIADENPVNRVPWMTILLIVACTVVYFVVQPEGRSTFDPGMERIERESLQFAVEQAAIPCELVKGRPLTTDEFRETFRDGDFSACGEGNPGARAQVPGKLVYVAILVSMFLHGNIAHLLGNMLFLWVFGNNIEDRKGPWWYLAVYLASGLAATAAHVGVDPNSTVPAIGASGAVAGVLGAYVVWFPKARVKVMIPLIPFMLFRKVAAGWVLGLWFIQQFLLIGGNSNVAWAAHVGGFAFGALVGLGWRRNREAPPEWTPDTRPPPPAPAAVNASASPPPWGSTPT